MYANPVLLPQVSNREDFVLSMQLADDDTGQGIDLVGIATATGNAFTGAAWTVTDGAIVTASVTPITIPALPYTGTLSALALTVSVGLAIVAGDPITIADTATKKNTMTGYVISYASATGALVVQIGWTFQFEIRRVGPHWPGDGYTTFYDFGVTDQQAILTASFGNSYLTITDIGMLQILIPEAVFKTLKSGTYAACLTGTDSVHTRQLFIGRLPVLWGGVTN